MWLVFICSSYRLMQRTFSLSITTINITFTPFFVHCFRAFLTLWMCKQRGQEVGNSWVETNEGWMDEGRRSVGYDGRRTK